MQTRSHMKRLEMDDDSKPPHHEAAGSCVDVPGQLPGVPGVPGVPGLWPILENPQVPSDLRTLFPGFGRPDHTPAWRDSSLVPANLVLEGGSMRCQFTSGVLDYLMDRKLMPDTVIAPSAGAAIGVSYRAGSRGRAVYTNMLLTDDWRHYSKRSFLASGNLFNIEYSFKTSRKDVTPFDFQAFKDSPIKLYSVAADMETGEAHYHLYDDLAEEMDYLKASVALPLVFKTYHIEGRTLMDGGMYDSVPIRFSMSLGRGKHIVVLTQENRAFDHYFGVMRGVRGFGDPHPVTLPSGSVSLRTLPLELYVYLIVLPNASVIVSRLLLLSYVNSVVFPRGSVCKV